MPELIMFDASVHLGQFCLASRSVQLGCKQSQVSSMQGGTGLWADNENGRVDHAVWSLPRPLQDCFYPFMDRFFSTRTIAQAPLEEFDVRAALDVRSLQLGLTFQSAYTVAVAISRQVTQIHTLYSDLLGDQVKLHLRTLGITVLKPEAQEQAVYADTQLETAYQACLSAFAQARLEILEQINDPRARHLF